jgi:hypothetical protein
VGAAMTEEGICDRCSYVLAFYDGNTIFDFD